LACGGGRAFGIGGAILGRRRAPATPSAWRRLGAASRVHWRRYVSTSPRSGPYPTMDASPLGADGRMPLALRGLGLVGEGGHVLRAVGRLVRGAGGIWLGDGDRFELVLGLDRPIDGKVEGVVNIARICHETSVGVG